MSLNFDNWICQTFNKLDPLCRDGVYLSGMSSIICAGPPSLALPDSSASTGPQKASAVVMPLGVVQTFGFGANLQQFIINELGSKATYNITGRRVMQIQLGKVWYSGASLLRLMYAYYRNPKNFGSTVDVEPLYDRFKDYDLFCNDIFLSPGTDQFFAELASDLFAQPIGIMLVLRNTSEQTSSVVYFERAFVTGTSMAVDANNIVIQENVTLQPLAMKLVPTETISIMDTVRKVAGNVLGFGV